MPMYLEQGSFDLPSATIVFDALNDGRLIICNGAAVRVETAPGSKDFTDLAALPTGTPNFLRVSPGGGKAAVGDFDAKKIYTVDVESGTVASFDADSFDAEWIDDAQIAISAGSPPGGDGPVVTVLDTVGGSNSTIVRRAGNASGGVTFDRSGNLFVGNGFDAVNPAATGTIKAYPRSAWVEALSSGTPIDFRTTGRVVADLLSAAALGFDRYGNLHVGGGDSSTPDHGFAAVASAQAIADALGGGPPVTSSSPADVLQRLDPDAGDNIFWFVVTNPATGELYLKDFGQTKVTIFGFEKRRDHSTNATFAATDDVQMEDCNFHLGDNPGAFPGSEFVGLELQVPLPIPDFGGPARSLFVRVETSLMETLGVSQHRVLLGGTLLGTMTDGDQGDGGQGNNEQFEFPVPEGVATPGSTMTLTVQCQQLGGGLSDDFLVKKYGTRVTS